MHNLPTDQQAAYAAGQVHAYNNILVELDELSRKIRREIASLTLPTRNPRLRQDDGEVR